MTPPRGAAYAVALACLPLAARVARADDASIHLRYEVPPGCPSRADFVATLRARTPTSRTGAYDTRSFDVRVVRTADGNFSGKLEIRQADGASSTREIRDASCRAVTTSLAVFVAIALDPAPPPRSDRADGDPARDAPSTEPPPAASVEEARRATARAPSPPPISPPKPPPKPPPRRIVWSLRAGYAVAYLHAPEAGWGGRVHAELARSASRARVAPMLRLSWGWSDFSTHPVRAGEAEFRLKSVRVEGGPRIFLRPFTLTASGGIEAGTLTGQTSELAGSVPLTAPWSAATGTLRAAFAVLPWLALEASVTILVPFERHFFVVREPIRPVYQVPAALLEGSAGVAAVARFR